MMLCNSSVGSVTNSDLCCPISRGGGEKAVGAAIGFDWVGLDKMGDTVEAIRKISLTPSRAESAICTKAPS